MDNENRTPEKDILREAERLAQALDAFDALSWDRIDSIADSLKQGTGVISDEIAKRGAELKDIAEAGALLQNRGKHIGEKPAPEPEPEPDPEPDPEPEPEPDPEPEPEPEPDLEPESDSETEPESAPEPEPELESRPSVESETSSVVAEPATRLTLGSSVLSPAKVAPKIKEGKHDAALPFTSRQAGGLRSTIVPEPQLSDEERTELYFEDDLDAPVAPKAPKHAASIEPEVDIEPVPAFEIPAPASAVAPEASEAHGSVLDSLAPEQMQPTSVFEPAPEPEPEVFAAQPEPVPTPEPEVFAARPEPAPEPEPEVLVAQPEPVPTPEPETPIVQPEPESFAATPESFDVPMSYVEAPPTFRQGELPEWARYEDTAHQQAIDDFFMGVQDPPQAKGVFIPRGETGTLPRLDANGNIAEPAIAPLPQTAYASIDMPEQQDVFAVAPAPELNVEPDAGAVIPPAAVRPAEKQSFFGRLFHKKDKASTQDADVSDQILAPEALLPVDDSFVPEGPIEALAPPLTDETLTPVESESIQANVELDEQSDSAAPIGAGLNPAFIAQFEEAVRAAKEGKPGEGPALNEFIEQAKSMIGDTSALDSALTDTSAVSAPGFDAPRIDVAESAQEAIDNLYAPDVASEITPPITPSPEFGIQVDAPVSPEDAPSTAVDLDDAYAVPAASAADFATAAPAAELDSAVPAPVAPLFEPELAPAGSVPPAPTEPVGAPGDAWSNAESAAPAGKKLSWFERRKLRKQEKAAAKAAEAATAQEAQVSDTAAVQGSVESDVAPIDPPTAAEATAYAQAPSVPSVPSEMPTETKESASSEGAPVIPADQIETQFATEVARFRNLYTSRDGSMALYEDEDGHITAVNLNKLA